ncbi:MAG: NAD(+) synthase [Candidatus Obscuribacterales bacterium]|nr:NAD(+) synthase [Candidatus Obscuribacterales bacterium]
MTTLHPELKQMLLLLRAMRGFDAQKYLDAKTLLINTHFTRSSLSAAVVGVSGGIDSAVVLGMLAHAAKQPGSPLKHILCALLPYLKCNGTTNQDVATTRGQDVVKVFGGQEVVVDLTSSHSTMQQVIDKACGVTSDAWASGQLVSYLRTPAFYYMTALLAHDNKPAVFVGTTNRDEGGYIGYFGKAADAMVDIQLISDIHKSEVYALAKLLAVPQSVIEATPTGDIYDGRTDFDLIGVPYDFLELYSLYLCLRDEEQMKKFTDQLGADARVQFNEMSAQVQKLNRQNAHKYYGGGTSAHFDVYERPVPGGWRLETTEFEPGIRKPAPRFVNVVKLETPSNNAFAQNNKPGSPDIRRENIGNFGDSAFLLHNVLSASECEAMLAELLSQNWVPASINGMQKDFDPAKDPIGSWRATNVNDVLAEVIWQRIQPHFPHLRIMDDLTQTDFEDERVWRATGVAPVMRFIRYTEHGLLVPHYDSTHVQNENKRTLMSAVLYLTNNASASGGATRFIKDPQATVPVPKRDLKDWERLAKPDEILHSIAPQQGSILIFDHRILHDSESIVGDVQKVIMRTDITFRRGGLQVRNKASVAKPLGMPEVKG